MHNLVTARFYKNMRSCFFLLPFVVHRVVGLKLYPRCVSRAPFRAFSSIGKNDPPMKESDMTLDELKAELELRQVDYEDCVSKSELVTRLVESRTLGKANPELLNRFNEEETTNVSETLNSEAVAEVIAKDGGLPGGLSPDLMKALSSNPEIMRMLKDPKMQDIMRAVMTGGPEAMKKYLSDPDAVMLLQQLSTVMAKVMQK